MARLCVLKASPHARSPCLLLLCQVAALPLRKLLRLWACEVVDFFRNGEGGVEYRKAASVAASLKVWLANTDVYFCAGRVDEKTVGALTLTLTRNP